MRYRNNITYIDILPAHHGHMCEDCEDQHSCGGPRSSLRSGSWRSGWCGDIVPSGTFKGMGVAEICHLGSSFQDPEK